MELRVCVTVALKLAQRPCWPSVELYNYSNVSPASFSASVGKLLTPKSEVTGSDSTPVGVAVVLRKNHRVVFRIQTLLSVQVNLVWPHMVQLCVMRDAERGQVSWLSDLHLMSRCMTHKWAVTGDVPADGKTPICLVTKSTQNIAGFYTLLFAPSEVTSV